ncbi:MAG: PA14 domain-containing protein [Candidatus Hydrogenedentota bacterium]
MRRKFGVFVCLFVGMQVAAVAALQGDYYESSAPGEFTTLQATQVDFNVDFDWEDGGPPVLEGITDSFAIRWTGTLAVTTPGEYTFYSVTDDGARLTIDDVTVIDQWVDQGPTEHEGAITLAAGEHTLVFEYYENAGGALCRLLWDGPGLYKQVIPPSAFLLPEQGFSAAFHRGNTPLTTAPETMFNVSRIAFNWGTAAPVHSVPADHFSARFRGWINAPETGTYTFTVASDDGADLFVGGAPVIENFANPQALTENTGTIDLTAGQAYLVDLRYAELTGYAAVYLYWQTPSMTDRALLGGGEVDPAMRVAPAPGRTGVRVRRIKQDSDLTLAVQVEQAATAPTYEWRFQPANAPATETVMDAGTATDGIIQLHMSVVPIAGAGDYWCVVDDGRGPVTSLPFHVEVVESLPAVNILWLVVALAAAGLMVLWSIRRAGYPCDAS